MQRARKDMKRILSISTVLLFAGMAMAQTTDLHQPGTPETINGIPVGFSAGISSSTVYDDHPAVNETAGGIVQQTSPDFSFGDMTSRTQFFMTYAPSFTYNQRSNQQNYLAQSGKFMWSHRFGKRFTMTLNDSARYTYNPLEGLLNPTSTLEDPGNLIPLNTDVRRFA